MIVKRKRSESVTVRDQELIDPIDRLKRDHPYWGYRRIWAYLHYRDKIPVSRNRVYRVMKEHGYLVTKNDRLRAKRFSTRPKPLASRPNQYWGSDMTKAMILGFGWIYIHIVLDWYTKEIVGWHISNRTKSEDWLVALRQAVNTRYPNGIQEHVLGNHGEAESDHRLCLITDNGCQPTSVAYMTECAALGIEQIFTTWNNPRGNADTERVIRTMKEEVVWGYEWDTPSQFTKAFGEWVTFYNTDYPHSSLNYQTPNEAFFNFKPETFSLLQNAC